jgi:manganese/zinc/iron transport system ATP- binding protein
MTLARLAPIAATASGTQPLARVEGLSVSYGARLVLQGVTLSVPAGVVIGLAGPNGAGKTTLLRAVLGTIPISAGSIALQEPPAYMPQLGPGQWTFPLTALDLALQGSYRRLGYGHRPRRAERARARAALAAVGMQAMAGEQVGELSGGQRQRVLLARALVQDAALTLLDEPLSGADAPTEALFASVLADLRRRGRSAIVSTHDLAWAAAHCDLLCLVNGRVVASGEPREVLRRDVLGAVYGRGLLDLGALGVITGEHAT